MFKELFNYLAQNGELYLTLSIMFAVFCLVIGHQIQKSRENKKWLEFVRHIDKMIS